MIRLWLLILLVLISTKSWAAQRIAVLVADSQGWPEDVPLRHAVDDAQRLAETLELVGGFAREDIHLLLLPTSDQVLQTLDSLAERMRPAAGDVHFLFYYSGHADETHLHLRGAPLTYDELQRRLRTLPARLKIGILDACYSGGIITKGMRRSESFDVKVEIPRDMQGTVLLTSSGADEISQEHRTLAGSIFSHHLVSGLRGAADENTDGQVNLEEAYGYAFHRTLLDTAVSRKGVQRPQIQLDLRGQGAVPLTWLSGAAATLELPSSGWRCFITNAAETLLVAEAISKPQQRLPLALAPGPYVLKCKPDRERLLVARFSATAGERVVADMLGFEEVPLGSTSIVRKGGAAGRIPYPVSQPAPWGLTLGLQGEVELKSRRMVPALVIEALGSSTARLPGVRLGGAFTAILQPNPGIRLEGRVYPYELRFASTTFRPHLALGATTFLPDAVVGGHVGLGLGFQTSPLQFSAGAAYERFFNPGKAREPSAVLVSLGIAWAPFSSRAFLPR